MDYASWWSVLVFATIFALIFAVIPLTMSMVIGGWRSPERIGSPNHVKE